MPGFIYMENFLHEIRNLMACRPFGLVYIYNAVIYYLFCFSFFRLAAVFFICSRFFPDNDFSFYFFKRKQVLHEPEEIGEFNKLIRFIYAKYARWGVKRKILVKSCSSYFLGSSK